MRSQGSTLGSLAPVIAVCCACASNGDRAPIRATVAAPGQRTTTAPEARRAAIQAASASPPAPRASLAAPERNLGVHDRGIFSDLDERVQLALPGDLQVNRVLAVVDRARAQLVLYDGAQPVKVYPLGGDAVLQVGATALALRPGDRAELEPLLAPERLYVFEQRVELPPGDADGDGIPDPLDVLIGAHKTALNADRYDGRYEVIAYPGGDVPREIGVCTDVVIRAFRNAGYDLQRAVHEDIVTRRAAYPMVQTPNPHIDHRRVKSLLPYFARHQDARSLQLEDPRDPLRPGDVVFMDTFPDRPGAEHIGIVSDLHDEHGRPLVINNWTDGTVTKPMELLSWVPVTHRYRLPDRLPGSGPIPALKTQLLRVVSESWTSFRAQLQRYERTPGGPWSPVGAAIPAVLGHAGLGWGDGLHGEGAPAGRPGPLKREGDGRSPAGVFALGMAYGTGSSAEAALRIGYEQSTPEHLCVDDPASAQYNRVVVAAAAARDFKSAEVMKRDDGGYEIAIEIAHNRAPTTPAHGSCIFLHVWAGPTTPVLGCTAMARDALHEVARWLQPNAAVVVALPRSELRALQRTWRLP